MRTAPSPPPRDPEFDGPPRVTGQPSGTRLRYYQRLIVNPFLVVVGVCVTVGLQAWIERGNRSVPNHPMLLFGILLSLCLLQYHCLDCGATGMFHGWKKHICPGIADRWNSGYPFWNRIFPTPPTQFALWLIAFLAAGIWLMAGLQR